jgi:hypothetical protein
VLSEADRKEDAERYFAHQLEQLDEAFRLEKRSFDMEWDEKAATSAEEVAAARRRLQISHETELRTLENTVLSKAPPPPKFTPELLNLRRMAELQNVAMLPELALQTKTIADEMEEKEMETYERSLDQGRAKQREALMARHAKEMHQMTQREVKLRFKVAHERKVAWEKLQQKYRGHRQDIEHAHKLELARKAEPSDPGKTATARRPVTAAASSRATQILQTQNHH